jgi:NAD(P)-dependent dehydrogenase (short-subunit alcohol dehydrogenase family)
MMRQRQGTDRARRAQAILVSGNLQSADHCRDVVRKAIGELGGIDILVNNAEQLGNMTAPCLTCCRRHGARLSSASIFVV